MRYLPKSESDREVMLREIGATSIDDLFATIPAEYRLKRDLNIPRAYAESEIVEFFRQRAPIAPRAMPLSSAPAHTRTIGP